MWHELGHSRSCMAKALSAGCTCGLAWRLFQRLCAIVGCPLIAVGFVAATPGLLVADLGERIRDLPWWRRARGESGGRP